MFASGEIRNARKVGQPCLFDAGELRQIADRNRLEGEATEG
jgi:hypothetical protein